ncbi:uncharacterized protein LOC62_04G005317 [Vanrija pseudolonga]|uniref:F-box domain-containing protein n=1 Tax=Vanrija pseudolonga TaxID=143232 RepID=A0AAF0YC85_9TREE|nr:hypothetical protein LOC62_04G005317 [Vanrija pseudolonga]
MSIDLDTVQGHRILNGILKHADLRTVLAISATSKRFRSWILEQLFSHVLVSASQSGNPVLALSVPAKGDNALFITRRRYTAPGVWPPHVWGSLHTLDLDLRHCREENWAPLTEALTRFDRAPNILRRMGQKAMTVDWGIHSDYVVDFNDETVDNYGTTKICMLPTERRHYLHLALDQGGSVNGSGRVKLEWPDSLGLHAFKVIIWPYESGGQVTYCDELWSALDGLVDVVLRHCPLYIVGLERFDPEAVVSTTRERAYGTARQPFETRFLKKLRSRWATKLTAYQYRRGDWSDVEDPMRWVTCPNWHHFEGEEESSTVGLSIGTVEHWEDSLALSSWIVITETGG